MIFLDTSLLLRRYWREGPVGVPEAVLAVGGRPVAVSDLVRVEMASAVARRVRQGAMLPSEGREILASFRAQFPGFLRVPLDGPVLDRAEALTGRTALRSLDALQLASALEVADSSPAGAFRFGSADARLNAAAKAEGLEIL